MEKQYFYRGRAYPIPAQTAGEELEKVEQIYGNTNPENQLAFCRSHETALSKCFEWNNEKAAELYRLQQGRVLNNAIHVKILTLEGTEKYQQKYIPVRIEDSSEKKNKEYINYETVIQNEDFSRQYRESVLKNIEWLKGKLFVFNNVAKASELLDALAAEINQ